MLRDGAQTKILSCNQDLKMMKIQTSGGEDEIDGTCRNLADLSKILRNRNKQYSVQSMKIKRHTAEEITHEDEICFGRLMTKVRMQQEQLLTSLQRNSKKSDSEVDQKQQAFLQPTSQQNQPQVSFYHYFRSASSIEESKIRKFLEQTKEDCNEDIQNLAECFRQKANISAPIVGRSLNNEQKYILSDIAKYRAFFEELTKERISTDDHTLNWFSILNDQKTCPFREQYFQMTVKSLAKYWKVSAYHPRKRVLMEVEGLQSAMEIFAKDEAKERRFLRQRLKQQEYWQKICYLFSKGSSQYYLIQYHLKYGNQYILLDHFNKITQGKDSNFQPSSQLLSENQYYRQFVMLLDCKYLHHCLRNEKFTEEKFVYIAIREISLLILKNQPYTFQYDYLIKATTILLEQLNIAFDKKPNIDKIQKLLEELYSLSQFGKAIRLLFQYSKISTYQYLLLYAMLYQGDIPHSKLLLYKPHQIQSTFKQIITTIVSRITSQNPKQFLALISGILPAFCNQDKDFVIDILTLNQFFFEYIMKSVGFPSLTEMFSLGLEDVSSILKTCIERHSNYTFCLELGISSCINLLDLSKLVFEENNEGNSTIIQQRSSRLRKKNIKIANKDLNLFKGFPQRYIQRYEQKFRILVDCMKILIETNINLTRDSNKLQETYEELLPINELYQQLTLEKVSKQIITILQLKDDGLAKTYQDCIKNHRDMMILSFSMTRIKISIFNRNFQSIVELLNILFIQIADDFVKIIKGIQSLPLVFQPNDALLSFIGDIIQALLFLQAEKPKVIDRNKIILRQVCKEIHLLLKSLNILEHQTSFLFQKLQGIMSSLSHFSKER